MLLFGPTLLNGERGICGRTELNSALVPGVLGMLLLFYTVKGNFISSFLTKVLLDGIAAGIIEDTIPIISGLFPFGLLSFGSCFCGPPFYCSVL